MKPESKAACDALVRSCELTNAIDIEIYQQAIAVLRTDKDPEILKCMLKCLRDTDAGEIQYELVEACEAFSDEVYVREFSRALPEIRKSAPHWGRLMFQSVLNHGTCQRVLWQTFPHQLEVIKHTIRIWLEEISKGDRRYQILRSTLPP